MEQDNIKAIFFRDVKNNYIANILKEMYIDKVYERFVLGRKDLIVLDVGANVGIFTQYIYPYASKIYSLEPSKPHIEVLNTMISYNKLEDKVKVIDKALSHENGKAKFYHNDNTTMFSLRDTVNKQEDYEEVETITFDRLFEENNIDHVDFVKLDVEGSECEILGSEGFDKVSDKINVIVGEYHNWSGFNPEQLKTTLMDRGFRFYWLGRTEASLFVAERAE